MTRRIEKRPKETGVSSSSTSRRPSRRSNECSGMSGTSSEVSGHKSAALGNASRAPNVAAKLWSGASRPLKQKLAGWLGSCSARPMARERTRNTFRLARRYRASLGSLGPATFRCGSASFDLDVLVAVVGGRSINIRPQEARLLAILFGAEGRVVGYERLTSLLYGAGVPREACRARLKSLVADVRRRFGSGLSSAIRTAPTKGLVLQLDDIPLLDASIPCSVALAACTPLGGSLHVCRGALKRAAFLPASHLPS